MDRLRKVAQNIELAKAVAAIETLIKWLQASNSPSTQGVTASLTAALHFFEHAHTLPKSPETSGAGKMVS